jgi:hypothetical protein
MSIATLQRKLIKKREKISQLYTEASAIKELLQGVCDHAKTEDYRWEHDNGYGRQSMTTGKRCVFCGWIKLYSHDHSKFTDPKDFTD